MAQSLPTPEQDTQLALAELPLTADELERANRIDFRVERDSEVPVGTQLGWKLHAMLARGVLRPGDRVPSVRELADFAGVNVNTARAVYGELEAEGLISSQQGRGTFVTVKADELRELGELVARGDLRVVEGATYGLSEVRRLHEDLAARRTSGKLVIDPAR